MYYHCENCGYTKEEIPRKKHVGYVAKDGKAATCTEPGLTALVRCELCDEVLQTQEEIPAPGHKVVVDEAVKASGHKEVVEGGKEPTCMRSGKTGEKYCATCGKVQKNPRSWPQGRSRESSSSDLNRRWINGRKIL